MSSIQTAEKEVIRAEILEMLSIAGGDGCGEKVLKAALKKSCYGLSEEDVLRQLSYLKGKGLVRTVEVNNPRLGIRRTIAYITAAGMDCLEGNGGEITGVGE